MGHVRAADDQHAVPRGGRRHERRGRRPGEHSGERRSATDDHRGAVGGRRPISLGDQIEVLDRLRVGREHRRVARGGEGEQRLGHGGRPAGTKLVEVQLPPGAGAKQPARALVRPFEQPGAGVGEHAVARVLRLVQRRAPPVPVEELDPADRDPPGGGKRRHEQEHGPPGGIDDVADAEVLLEHVAAERAVASQHDGGVRDAVQ